MSDTPRTDAAYDRMVESSHEYGAWSHLADESRRLERELTVAQDRLQIDPGGSDKIDELEQAAQFLRHTIERLKEDLAAVNLERDGYKHSANFHRDMGITLLDQKYLDPACHKGCQSLVWQEKLSTSIDESCELRAQLNQLETLILEDGAGVQVIKAERDKLLGFYVEIVKELGHDCVLRELRNANALVTRLRDVLAFYAGTLREDGNGYEFAKETLTGEKARETISLTPEAAGKELAALREDKADLDWLQRDPQNRFVRAISTWMKVGSNPSVITIRDAIRAARKDTL